MPYCRSEFLPDKAKIRWNTGSISRIFNKVNSAVGGREGALGYKVNSAVGGREGALGYKVNSTTGGREGPLGGAVWLKTGTRPSVAWVGSKFDRQDGFFAIMETRPNLENKHNARNCPRQPLFLISYLLPIQT